MTAIFKYGKIIINKILVQLIFQIEVGGIIMNNKKQIEPWIIVIIAAGVVIVASIVIIIISCVISYRPYNPSATVTCNVCHQEFKKDSNNAKSINRTNMCTNCYNNYKSAQEAAKELPV